MIEELLSNILLIAIVFVGIGYMVSGKPKKYTEIIGNRNGDKIYIKKDNFTKRMIKLVITISILMFFVKYFSL